MSYYVALSSVEKDAFPKHTKHMKDVQDFTWKLGCQFRHGEHEKLSMKEATKELASLISSLESWSKEMPTKEYVQLAKEEIVSANCNMANLVDLAWGREIHLGLDLNEESMQGNDVDDQPTPIIKLMSMSNYYQILQWSIFWSFNCRCDEHETFYG